MEITCISDLHGETPILPGGDVLIIAGDLTANDRQSGYERFFKWLWPLPYERKILVAGNHDGRLEKFMASIPALPHGFHYLNDSGCEYKGINFWGSPYTPKFFEWAFMSPDEDLSEHWDKIPDDTDIVITHGPAYSILDKTVRRKNAIDPHVGSKTLYEALQRIRPKFHVCGHIHEGYGKEIVKWYPYKDETTFVNCAHLNEEYDPVNDPIIIIIKEKE